jgi:hypothetical protein
MLLLLPAMVACAPRARPLPGVEAGTGRLPQLELPSGYQQMVFRWDYSDPDMIARGDGAARIAPPDSGRVDFFLDGGLGAGRAVLIGTDLRIPPAAEFARRFFPPAPLLWAALGRIAVPPAADTIVRVSGDTVRADIGTTDVWRVTIIGHALRRVERINGGRIVEQVDRGDGVRIRYDHLAARRMLQITITRSFAVSGFDDEIWTP